MPKPTYPKEELQREGHLVSQAIAQAEKKGIDAPSQEVVMAELGYSQSNLSQWLKGTSRISDRNLVWLGTRYDFDVLQVRPEMSLYKNYFAKWGIMGDLSPSQRERILGLIRDIAEPRITQIDSDGAVSQEFNAGAEPTPTSKKRTQK